MSRADGGVPGGAARVGEEEEVLGGGFGLRAGLMEPDMLTGILAVVTE